MNPLALIAFADHLPVFSRHKICTENAIYLHVVQSCGSEKYGHFLDVGSMQEWVQISIFLQVEKVPNLGGQFFSKRSLMMRKMWLSSHADR
jgi:hypothetical protein